MKLIFIILPQIYFLKFRIYCSHIIAKCLETLHTAQRPHLPKMHLPKIRFPEIAWPEVKIPTPQIKWPNIALPTIKLPIVKLPTIRLPTLDRPHFQAFKRPVLSSTYIINSALIFTCFYILVGITSNVSASGGATFTLALNKNIPITAEEYTYSEDLNALVPASGHDDTHHEHSGHYAIEQNIIDIETVLIPRKNTVISSSRDSKIKTLFFDNGEHFKKGDVLVEYACEDARAEVEIAKIQQNLSAKKSDVSHKLFKLDIISDLEKYELETENKQASARIDLYESRMNDCLIRAEYDGHVIKRLANAGEFTRTDRVLMEVASLDYLKAEFLMPSRWLRWVNIGAPIQINIGETDKTYHAVIKYIYGEVDPVSQSIQMTAQLDPYEDPLLPGMSGYAHINLNAIREAGVHGFLEKTSYNDER